MANGFSVSALAGKREFMELGGLEHTTGEQVFLLSTTHGAETHALAAAIATMRIYQRRAGGRAPVRQGARLRDGLERGRRAHGVSDYVQILGRPAASSTPPRRRRQAVTAVPDAAPAGVDPPRHAGDVAVVSYSPQRRGHRPTVEAFDGALAVYRRRWTTASTSTFAAAPSKLVYRAYN